MNYGALRELIDHFEAFEQEATQYSVQAFSEWLYHRMHPKTVEPVQKDYFEQPLDLDNEIAGGIGILSQHARHYVKTALRDTALVSIMDYLFLASLLRQGDLRKSDLINSNLVEFSPGMEVIRRLLRKKLAEDYVDPDDKRSKRVRITAQGRAEFFRASQSMLQASRIVTGNLTEKEKVVLVSLVRKLMAFHQPIWESDNGTDLTVLLRRYKSEASTS
ncbi:MAG: winged helix-turn-helix transcriptional regulator [Phaeodactylibacter sp.]|nr:winged helix-turn-helix transcriptional regulator [Phaeodactylibacter sp.]